MEAINQELDKLLEHKWQDEIKMSINNLRMSVKSFNYLITKSTKNDILDLIKLANQIKKELCMYIEKVNILTSNNDSLLKENELLLKDNEALSKVIDLRDQELEILKQEIMELKGISNK